jgi:hypothetical protein
VLPFTICRVTAAFGLVPHFLHFLFRWYLSRSAILWTGSYVNCTNPSAIHDRLWLMSSLPCGDACISTTAHFMFVAFYSLYRVVNPRFTPLILLFASSPTNLVGVPALTYGYCRLRLAASPTYIKPVPRCWSTCECTWLVVPPLC